MKLDGIKNRLRLYTFSMDIEKDKNNIADLREYWMKCLGILEGCDFLLNASEMTEVRVYYNNQVKERGLPNEYLWDATC